MSLDEEGLKGIILVARERAIRERYRFELGETEVELFGLFCLFLV